MKVMTEDPRSVRSKQRLREALHRLIADEDFSNVGVAALCREAGVHRTTFYGHYESVSDLAAELYADRLDALAGVEIPSDASPATINQAFSDAMLAVLEAVRDERPSFRSLLGAKVSVGFRKRLFMAFVDRSTTAIALFREHGLAKDIDTETGAAYMAGATLGVVEAFAWSDEEDAAAYAARIVAHMPRWWPAA